METFQQIWQEDHEQPSFALWLSKENVNKLVQGRIKKERKVVAEYFWASLTYQIIVYSFAAHLFVKYWGNMRVIVLALLALILYIPFTMVMMKKYKAMYNPASPSGDLSRDIQAHVRNQYELLSQFFKLKKWFDWIAMPLSSLIITGSLFTIYGKDAFGEHVGGAILTFFIILVPLITATWFENRKRFLKPLRQFESILEDLNKNE